MAKTEQEDLIADVGATAEAFTADDGAPLHEIESLCMRCGKNVCSLLLNCDINEWNQVGKSCGKIG